MKRWKILIVDDDQSSLELLKEMLLSPEIEVVCVSDGQRAIDYVSALKVDLVITDVWMPKIQGTELFFELKKINPFLQIIMATVEPKLAHIAQMLSEGASDFIIKPFDAEQISQVVHQALAGIERWKDLRRPLAGAMPVIPDWQMRVLVVDDDNINVELIREILSSQKITTEGATSGRAALEYVARHEVDLVITDVKMPEMGGVDLFYNLKRKCPFLQIVMITAYPKLSDVARMLESGANDFLVKPIDAERLCCTVNAALARAARWRKLRKELAQYHKRRTISG